jgi:hypothetical protein
MSRKIEVAVIASLSVKSFNDVNEFMRDIGLKPLFAALLHNSPNTDNIDRIEAVKGICRLTREKHSIANDIAQNSEIVSVLCDFLEAPLNRFLFRSEMFNLLLNSIYRFHLFQSQYEKDRNMLAQRESIALIQRLVRSSDKAVEILRNNLRLKKILNQILSLEITPGTNSNSFHLFDHNNSSLNSRNKQSPKKNLTTIIEYSNLSVYQMAR